MRPMPAPTPIGTAATCAGCLRLASPMIHSAVDEHPIVPTLPLDQGCSAIQVSVSCPSVRGWPRISHSPSEKNLPRSYCMTKA